MNTYNYILSHFPIWLWGSVIILIALLVQTFIISCVQYLYYSHAEKQEISEIGLWVFQVTGTIYAILLGLLNYVALDNFQILKINLINEANQIENIFRNIDISMDRKKAQPLERQLFQYLDHVIFHEFKIEQSGYAVLSLKQREPGWEYLSLVSKNIIQSSSINDTTKSKILDNLNDLYNSRRIRINNFSPLPDIIWYISSISIFLMMINISICSTKSLRVNIFTSYLFVVSMCLIIIITIDINKPFFGTINLSNNEFLNVRKNMLNVFGINYLTDTKTFDSQGIKHDHFQ